MAPRGRGRPAPRRRARVRARRRTDVEELVARRRLAVATDHVVVAVGVRPATAWLEGSGLRSADIRTALPHVYAAGDVTGGGHWEAAARQGAAVARALLGLAPAPPAPPRSGATSSACACSASATPAGARATIAADPEGRGFEAVYRREGRISAVLLAGRSAADLRAARRLLTPEPQLERSAA